jgi:NADH-quinone oxidoreductase subunit H
MLAFITPELIAHLVIIVAVFFALQISAAVLVYMERKVAAFVQQRYGPYLVGPRGLLQPLADILKLVMKEELRPKAADTILFYVAPVLSATAAFAAFSVVPFGADADFSTLAKITGITWLTGWTGLSHPIHLAAADVDVGVLVLFAITSMGVYGVVLAGWASNSKYSLLGGLRSSAQMISYELAYGMSFAAVILMANSLSIREIVDQQAGYWSFFGYGPAFIPKWYGIFPQFFAFLIFMIAGVAETNRAPFDFPEAEQELVAGYHTEYSSMSFALFFLAEYINMVTVSAVATDLFLGGWHGPFLPVYLGWIWFFVKVFAILFFYIWMRWTLPRYRYDQLMEFGWKWLLPAAVINLLVTAGLVIYFHIGA